MAKKDINKSSFDETTTLKLDIFRGCFREWYPVFVKDHHTTKIYVYDMFAGSGEDSEGHEGSPLILLNEAKGNNDINHCATLVESKKKVEFTFNEINKKKCKKLEALLIENLSSCRTTCELEFCPYDSSLQFKHEDFDELIRSEELLNVLKDKEYAKFVLLDQYGYKYVSSEVFKLLISSPKTDVVFFISSSSINRFKHLPAVEKYFNTDKIEWDEAKTKEVHRLIKDYYASLVPEDMDYYLHSFTMKKGSNYYGLIFCTAHSLGMEKFIRICWDKDKQAGESNCNVGDFFQMPSLFKEMDSKEVGVKKELAQLVLNGTIKSNTEGLKKALKLGCRARVFVEAIEELIAQDQVIIQGKFNKTATNIHKAKEYKIVVK